MKGIDHRVADMAVLLNNMVSIIEVITKIDWILNYRRIMGLFKELGEIYSK